MEDFIQTKIAPDGEWMNINLSEMARILQAANPGKEIITTGKEGNQTAGVAKAETDRKRLKGRI